jgi:hypothetical protein
MLGGFAVTAIKIEQQIKDMQNDEQVSIKCKLRGKAVSSRAILSRVAEPH